MATHGCAGSAWLRPARHHDADGSERHHDAGESTSGEKRRRDEPFSDADRHPRRPLFDKLTNRPASQAEMTVERAPRFVEAVVTYPDKRELLHKLVNPEMYGLFRLREAVSISSGAEHFQTTILPLLRLLQCDELQRPSLRQNMLQILLHLFRTPTLLNELWQNAWQNAQSKDHFMNATICKFLTSIVTASQDARKDQLLCRLGDLLMEYDTSGAAELMAVLKPPAAPANHLSNNTGNCQ
jgi:hypothetical protein